MIVVPTLLEASRLMAPIALPCLDTILFKARTASTYMDTITICERAGHWLVPPKAAFFIVKKGQEQLLSMKLISSVTGRVAIYSITQDKFTMIREA